MARGFGFVNQAAAVQAAKGGSSLWAGKLIFKLPEDGDTAIVRFLPDEEDEFVYGAWHHEVPVEGRAWGDLVPCIAQDDDGNRTDDECPGCENDLPMKFKGYIKLIWFDGPVYKTNEKGKIVKDSMGDPVVQDNKDQVAIWSSGPRLFEELEEIDDAYGLGTRPFRVKRRGTGTDTKYAIVPADPDGGKKAPKASEKKLIKEDEIDLAPFIKPPSYDEFNARLTGEASSSSNGDSGGKDEPSEAAAKRNPFKRK